MFHAWCLTVYFCHCLLRMVNILEMKRKLKTFLQSTTALYKNIHCECIRRDQIKPACMQLFYILKNVKDDNYF